MPLVRLHADTSSPTIRAPFVHDPSSMPIAHVPPYNTCAAAAGAKVIINGACPERSEKKTSYLRVHHRLVKLVELQLQLALELRQLLHHCSDLSHL